MRIFLVASALPSWMATGYGAALLKGSHDKVLVSFVDFIKPGNEQGLDVTSMPTDYAPKKEDP